MKAIRDRLNRLGYQLNNYPIDAWGKKHRYSTSPSASAGSTCYFETIQQVEQYVKQVEQVREWQAIEV